MRTAFLTAALVVTTTLASTAAAQSDEEKLPERPTVEGDKSLIAEMPMTAAKPTKEHEWLHQLVGTWRSESNINLPDGGEFNVKGSSTNRMVGGYWLHSEVVSDMGGQSMAAIQQIGYDPEKKQFIGTWIDGTSAHIWRYTGKLSEDGKTLILEARGPNFMTGEGVADFRDTYRVESPDHLVAVSFVKQDGGQWQEIMKADVKRVE